jgi:hypothetical protein
MVSWVLSPLFSALWARLGMLRLLRELPLLLLQELQGLLQPQLLSARRVAAAALHLG